MSVNINNLYTLLNKKNHSQTGLTLMHKLDLK